MNKTLSRALAAVLALGATSVNADIVHNDDVIITPITIGGSPSTTKRTVVRTSSPSTT